jgi:hypothetical protein
MSIRGETSRIADAVRRRRRRLTRDGPAHGLRPDSAAAAAAADRSGRKPTSIGRVWKGLAAAHRLRRSAPLDRAGAPRPSVRVSRRTSRRSALRPGAAGPESSESPSALAQLGKDAPRSLRQTLRCEAVASHQPDTVVLARRFRCVLDLDRVPVLHQQAAQLLSSLVPPPPVIFRKLHSATVSRLTAPLRGLEGVAKTPSPVSDGIHHRTLSARWRRLAAVPQGNVHFGALRSHEREATPRCEGSLCE